MTDLEIQEKVRNLRRFYINTTIYCFAVVAATMIWAVGGGGHFWPIWIIFIGGAALVLQAMSIGIFPMLNEYFPYFSEEWEEDQIKQMKRSSNKSHATHTPANTSAKPTMAKRKPAAKKAPVAKAASHMATAVKKAVTKKPAAKKKKSSASKKK